MAKMTLAKWKKIGRICGYDGTKSASVWNEKADKMRKACSYEMWKKIAQSNGYGSDGDELAPQAYEITNDPTPIRIGEIREFLKQWCQDHDPGGAYTDRQRKIDGLSTMANDQELLAYVASLLGFRNYEEDNSAFIDNPSRIIRRK